MKSSDIYQKVAIWTFPIIFLSYPTKPNERSLDPSFRDRVANDMDYLSEFLMWLVNGEIDYRMNRGLRLPQSVLDAVAEYRLSMEPMTVFAEAALEFVGNEFISSKDIYRAYSQWANHTGLKYVLDQMSFM